MLLYIDCTETYKTKLNTGIQRVVKKIASHDPSQQDTKIVPVRFDGIGFIVVQASELESGKLHIIKKSRNLIVQTPLYPIASWFFKRYQSLKTLALYPKYRKQYVKILKEDTFLVADIVRSYKYVETLQNMKKRGIDIYQVAFDILPIKYPEFFVKSNTVEFKRIAHQWPTYSTKIYAISKKVANEIKEELKFNKVDFFHLGSDFLKQINLKNLTPMEAPFFLSVGTVEPRKNHIHILNTFLKLWSEGFSKKLVFIGRIGWNFQEILQIIKEIKIKYPQNFLWLENLDDEGLEAFYQNAEAVICASYDEGFGLPIVESLSRNKDVLCSNIEVFREIGTQYCSYFNFSLEGPNSLYEIIKEDNFHKDLSNFKWLSWQESIDLLIDKILKDKQ
jgi:glycosyltransferase involved in cell wall biosynthesis